MLEATRSSLHVVTTEKGVVVGRIVFSGDIIDCTNVGISRKAIPPNIDRVAYMKTDTLFIVGWEGFHLFEIS